MKGLRSVVQDGRRGPCGGGEGGALLLHGGLIGPQHLGSETGMQLGRRAACLAVRIESVGVEELGRRDVVGAPLRACASWGVHLRRVRVIKFGPGPRRAPFLFLFSFVLLEWWRAGYYYL